MSGLWEGFNDQPRQAGGDSVINNRRFPPDLEAIMKPWVRAGYDKYKRAAETVVGLTDVFKPFPDRRGLYRPTGTRGTPALGLGALPKVAALAGR